jgi:electron transfer flavoprotein alpha subunit
MNISDYKGVWVFCEQRGGKIVPAVFELVSEARRLAGELGAEVTGLLLGNNVSDSARELGGYGADRVIVCESSLLETYTTDGYTNVLCGKVNDEKPEIMLFAATAIGRDLAPRCAARLHTGLTADCTHLDVDMGGYIAFLKESSTLDTEKTPWNREDKGLKMTRPAFGGHLMATIICPRFRPQMSTVRPGVMKRREFDKAAAERCVVETYSAALTDSDIRTQVIEHITEAKTRADISEAEIIVAVGGGIRSDVAKGIALAQELADALGGTLACSRAAVEAGWLEADRQVGQTGKTVRPKVYVALGISGTIQHVIGMRNAEYIIAVNKNENAPIFETAAYGIRGDLFQILPQMIAGAKKLK